MVRHMLMTPSLSPARDTSGHPDAMREPTSDEVLSAIRAVTGTLPQIDLAYESQIRTLWVTLKPEPKPVFTLQVIASVRKVQDAVIRLWSDAVECPVLFFAYRGVGPVFSLGGDLDHYLDCLAENDSAALANYANLAAEVIVHNNNGLNGLAITLATIHGKALGGGIDPARACNVLIGEHHATFGYPEIHYNHFPISAVPILSRHVGMVEAERILTLGRDYTAAEFHERGVLDAVVPSGTGEDWIRNYASRNMPTHRARVALTAAFNRRTGNLSAELAEAVDTWVNHFTRLKPIEISKLQRIAQVQERMLAKLSRGGAPSLALHAQNASPSR
jgi:DSF synthase